MLQYESFINRTRLCKWIVPIPGGFHMDKQGLIPVVKRYRAGSRFGFLVYPLLIKRDFTIFGTTGKIGAF